jgi:hypothetical protein
MTQSRQTFFTALAPDNFARPPKTGLPLPIKAQLPVEQIDIAGIRRGAAICLPPKRQFIACTKTRPPVKQHNAFWAFFGKTTRLARSDVMAYALR